jgi:hypothetical protein
MNESRHPSVVDVDLYMADRSFVSEEVAAHLDACAECRTAVGLDRPIAASPGRSPARLEARPAFEPGTPSRSRWPWAAGALLAAASVLVGVALVGRVETPPVDATSRGTGAKGPGNGSVVVRVLLREGETVLPFEPMPGAVVHPGQTMVFVAAGTGGHPVLAFFEASGDAGVLRPPETSSSRAFGFTFDDYVGRQRIALLLYDDPPDVAALDAQVRAAWGRLAPEARAGLPEVVVPGTGVRQDWIVESRPR